MSRVVTDALRERYAQIEKQRGRASVEELLAIAHRAAAHLKKPGLPPLSDPGFMLVHAWSVRHCWR